MVFKKGKRKIEYRGTVFYWFVRTDNEGILKIHILSEDKKVNLVCPLFDSEIPVTPAYIKYLLERHFGESTGENFNGGMQDCGM